VIDGFEALHVAPILHFASMKFPFALQRILGLCRCGVCGDETIPGDPEPAKGLATVIKFKDEAVGNIQCNW
jgi:hypothetical protein